MKKIGLILFSLAFFGLTYGFLWKFYPKNLGMFPGFVILYLLDIYLYWIYRDKIWSGSKTKGIFITAFFWMPMFMLIAMAIVSIWNPYDNWGRAFKNYYAGLIFAGYVSKLIPLFLMLVSDALILIRRTLQRNHKPSAISGKRISRSNFIKKLGMVAGGLFFGSLTLGMFKWVYDFKIRKKIIQIPDLPEVFNGLRIVQLSDIHLGSWISRRELKEAVNIVNDLNPDLVFFTGDLVNYTTDEAYPFEDILSKIEARSGVYSVLGNHDYGDYKRWKSQGDKKKNLTDMYRLHERMGWTLLRNEHALLHKGRARLGIVGVENWGSLKRFQKFGDIDKAMKGLKGTGANILLTHDPTHWQYKVSETNHSIDLTFSGHTHGAQFGIEIPGIRWSPSQYIYKYWAGLYSKENQFTKKSQYLYVNRGLGAIGYPGRVGILPEITLVELQS